MISSSKINYVQYVRLILSVSVCINVIPHDNSKRIKARCKCDFGSKW